MKVTVDIPENIGDKYKEKFDISINYADQVFINDIEVISEEEVNEIGYYLSDSKPRGAIYPDRLIVSLGDDRKLKYGQTNDWSLQFGNYATYTFEEIFEIILTEQYTEPMDEEYAINFKKHLIGIYDKTVKNIKKGDTK